MAKDYWQVLDLRKRSTWGPYDEQFIVLHMTPRKRSYSEHYYVGWLITENGKTYFRHADKYGLRDIAEMRKHYYIEWIDLVPPVLKEAL